jgi:hypothetical protein
MPGVDFHLLRERIAMLDILQLRRPVARPMPGAWFAESAEALVVGERASGPIPAFPLWIAGARVGTVGCGARRKPVCRSAGVVPTVGTGDTLGDALVAEAGQETTHR